MHKISTVSRIWENVEKGVEAAIKQNPDTELAAVFTRRPPERVKSNTPKSKVLSISDT